MVAATSNLTLDFFLELAPRPASRPRFACRGKFAQAYTDGAYREWQEQAKALLAKHRPFNTTEPHQGDVLIDVTAIVERPKKTVKVRPKGDKDNYEKGIYDAITQTGGFWEDDDQVVGPVSDARSKRWAEPGETPGYQVRIVFLA